MMWCLYLFWWRERFWQILSYFNIALFEARFVSAFTQRLLFVFLS